MMFQQRCVPKGTKQDRGTRGPGLKERPALGTLSGLDPQKHVPQKHQLQSNKQLHTQHLQQQPRMKRWNSRSIS